MHSRVLLNSHPMDLSVIILVLLAVASPVLIHVLTTTNKKSAGKKKLPPGSLGLPLIGQSLEFLRALNTNTAEEWIRDRIRRYGPVSKASLMGAPTVLLTGLAANKFIFFSKSLAMQQPRSVQRILGERTIMELMGAEHKRIRGAIFEFLRPEMLRQYVGRIDGEVRRHLDEHWAGGGRPRTVTVLPTMKRLTFEIISLLLFGLERGPVLDALAVEFDLILEGMWAVPVNLPFTAFNRSMKSSARIRRIIAGITRETRAKLQRCEASRSSDLIACLLSHTDDSGVPLLTEDEIIENSIVTLIGGHDTSSILMTFMIRHLAEDPDTLAAIVQEQDEIAKSKGDGEALVWDDLAKMKYTWRVAQETLRLVPPILGNFRRAIEDVEFEGYLIPKGWQVFWAASETHMDGSIFQEPAKFDPSRFESQVPPNSFIAFGAGPRICVGMEFARIETLVVMHYLVRRFRWKLREKLNNTFVRDPLPSPLHGLPIEVEEK